MTIREAFAAAGHPVPEAAKITFDDCYRCNHRAWFWFTEGDDVRRFDTWSNCWSEAHARLGVSNRVFFYRRLDISTLPAIDALDALPDAVKAVLWDEPWGKSE